MCGSGRVYFPCCGQRMTNVLVRRTGALHQYTWISTVAIVLFKLSSLTLRYLRNFATCIYGVHVRKSKGRVFSRMPSLGLEKQYWAANEHNTYIASTIKELC